MIRDFIERLNKLTEADWCRYAFSNEPLSGKITPEERLQYFRKAAECGASLAISLKERYGELPVKEYAARKGINVNYDETVYDGIFTMFAAYIHPNDITVFRRNALATDRLIAENGLAGIVGSVKTEDLLLAHELFHYYENRMPELYIHQKHILLFKIGRFENRSRLICLAEIAAMYFAKTLTDLPCSPYLYDVLMLHACNPQRAKQQFDRIMRITSGG